MALKHVKIKGQTGGQMVAVHSVLKEKELRNNLELIGDRRKVPDG